MSAVPPARAEIVGAGRAGPGSGAARDETFNRAPQPRASLRSARVGSVGDAYDNAMCESFFATLECELLNRRKFRTKAEARMAIFGFIEGWYNPSRRHSALGYKSPITFERSAQTELKSATR